MLVLSRSVGERLLIGEGVVLTVLGIRGKQVRLGLTAPETVSIVREEVDTASDRPEGRRKPRGSARPTKPR